MAIANWAGNQRAEPESVVSPERVDEMVDLVESAKREGRSIRVIGSGHSFTSIAMSDSTMMRTDRLNSISVEGDRVTVGAGVPLHRLNDALATIGLALPVLGDIDRQTVAGATSTGTHGTGIEHSAIAGSVVAFELVDGNGELRRGDIDGDHDERELWRLGRVSLGTFGVLTSLTFRCVPAFHLHGVDSRRPVDEVLADFEQFARSAEHIEFFWMPGAKRVIERRSNRTDRPIERPSPAKRWFDDYVLENLGLSAMSQLGLRAPRLAPRLARFMSAAASERDVVDRSDRVFVSRRLVRFVEMEYGLPLECMGELVPRVMEVVNTNPEPVLFPIEVRVSAADDIALSPGTGRTNGWIAVHQYRGAPYRQFFDRAEELFNEYEGARPHWGKMHQLGANDLRGRYPEWAGFHELRDRLDPGRLFANAYTDRVLD